MTRDAANLSVDFLVGFTIFLLAFIWVVSMVPGLLVNLQGYTIDYDAVAYRTGVILAEDPGEPSLPTSITPWEDLLSRTGVIRFGLAASKDTPNILSRKKVDRFFDMSIFSYPVDYQNRTIFGDYPYQFNISLTEMGSPHQPLFVGDVIGENSTHGSVKRLVRIKEPGLALINASFENATAHGNIIDGDNETVHAFTVRINKSELLYDRIKDPAYQINPGQEQTIINITGLNQTLYPDRSDCFNINFTSINITNEVSGFRYPVSPNLPPYTGYVDGNEFNATTFPEKGLFVNYSLSLIIDPPTYWSVVDKSDITLWFRLVNTTGPSRPAVCDDNGGFNGSRFINNTFTEPFGYNYSTENLIQPSLRNAILDINVRSGARTVTSIVVEALKADFRYNAVGLGVQFLDNSKGSPVEWDWDFGEGPHATTSNPTHMYNCPGTYTVTLKVTDASGNTDTTSRTLAFLPTVTGVTPDKGPTTGNTPVTITGTLLTKATDVRFGGISAAGFIVNSDNKITAISPAQAAGTVDITVTTCSGSDAVTTATSSSDRFTYVPPPAVTGISPSNGPTSGGTTVIVSGTGFTGATEVYFGTTAVTSSGFTVNSDTTITVPSPAGSGTVDITVTTPGGTSAPSAADQFTYYPAPAITTVLPASGTQSGGTLVTITGTNLAGATQVTFGGTAAAITGNTATTITVTTPAHAAGYVTVVVTTPGGTATKTNAYQYT